MFFVALWRRNLRVRKQFRKALGAPGAVSGGIAGPQNVGCVGGGTRTGSEGRESGFALLEATPPATSDARVCWAVG